MKPYLFTLCLCLLTQWAVSQTTAVKGKVQDRQTGQTLPGASITIANAADSTDKQIAITDGEGRFVFKNIKPGKHMVGTTFLGYQRNTQTVNVNGKEQTLAAIQLEPRAEKLGDVNVVAAAPPAALKGDTTEYSAAAYKVNPDANVEDLIKKMPGVNIENGTVKAQGEEVKKVLVDGKPFFGDDPSIALKNLPAEIIEKVQVFDQQSEQSQLTGFNDGQTTKTINIITRSDRRNGFFGNVLAGYGDQDRYVVGTNLSHFKGDQRFSAVVSSNNINRQNFGTQDFLGAMSSMGSSGGPGNRSSDSGGGSGGSRGGDRSGGSSSASPGLSNGISTIQSVGLNYSDVLLDNKLTLTASYFYNQTHNENNQIANTEYILSADSSRLENTNSISDSKNYNHRLNGKAEWQIDSMNTLIVIPSVNFQNNESQSGSNETQSFWIGGVNYPQNTSTYNSLTETSGYNISNRMTYRHKFMKTGRTLSADVNASFNKRKPVSSSLSNVIYETLQDTVITDRHTNTNTNGYTIGSNLAYTEPVGEISIVQINVGNSYTRNDAFKQTNDLDGNGNYEQIDTLSNKYLNQFITNKVGVSYRVKTKKINVSAGVEMQNANLKGDQTYPQTATTDKQFNNVLPNAYANIKLSDMQRITFNYNTSTSPPSITQLQNVSEYSSNLTRVTKGNPDLEPQYQHRITTRLMRVNKETRTNFFVLFGGAILQNSIGNSTVYLDTIQIITPVNKGTGYQLQSMANYGFTVKPIKCNLNLSGGYNYSRTPGFVNGNENIASTNAFSLSGVVSSNISEKIDFTLSSNGSYNLVHNTVSDQSDNNYYSQTSNFRFNWLMWKNFTLQNEVSNRLYRGLSSSYNQNVTVVNVGIGKKMFKNNAGEFRITVNDLFNNNTSISRSISANQITDQQSTTLNRYVMATFTYTFRNFKGTGEQRDEPREFERGRPGGEGMGPGPGGPPPGM